MHPSPPQAFPPDPRPDRDTARTVAVIAVFGACAYLLRGVLIAVCWSCLIAVSTWPLHDRLQAVVRRPALSAALLTGGATLLLLVPIVYLTYHGLREIPTLLRVWAESNDAGLPAPDWLGHLPLVGRWATANWNARVADPGALSDFVHGLAQKVNFHSGRILVMELGHRAMSLFFCILVLYVLFLRGAALAEQARSVVHRVLGRPGVDTLDLAVRAVRDTVNGLVLVGLALAAVMSIAYEVAGAPHPAFWGLMTGLCGIVPFGATVALLGVALYLLTLGATTAAIALAVFGGVLIFVTDHFIRPLFISGTSGVPLVLVLLGIVGGLETLGLLGLFVGPTLIAVTVAIWRELTMANRRRAVASDANPAG